MAEPPRHPDSDGGAEPERGASARSSIWAYVGVGAAALVVLLVVLLHATGVMGPGAH